MPRKSSKQSAHTTLAEGHSEKTPTTPKSRRGLVCFLLIGPIPFAVSGLLCIFHPISYSGSGGGYHAPIFSITYDASQTVDFGIFFLLVALVLSALGWRIFRK